MRLHHAGLLLLAAIVLIVGGARKVKAHSWYPIECCSGRDCNPVAVDDLIEQADGSWKHIPTGLVFPREKVRPSQDRHMHVCIGNSPYDMGKPLCAFVLQGS